ncbi:uncharacterized protein BDR25DRAFT_354792 [Lindgomyces ingoldianus]|uniref:Uncharacterized protein n=1 Tax=Lindgomyces ingoldianus TaxID=673940 RepID=A0ACB6QVA6_9PLEO|nr:uncharacterized protein BDR25DRAFT_354792 [Lindgomyces ingoldianus]KAF2470866.1 hypothetical protein BDR25DRAFT_354792 [Lindgomyces ingoldianus]
MFCIGRLLKRQNSHFDRWQRLILLGAVSSIYISPEKVGFLKKKLRRERGKRQIAGKNSGRTHLKKACTWFDHGLILNPPHFVITLPRAYDKLLNCAALTCSPSNSTASPHTPLPTSSSTSPTELSRLLYFILLSDRIHINRSPLHSEPSLLEGGYRIARQLAAHACIYLRIHLRIHFFLLIRLISFPDTPASGKQQPEGITPSRTHDAFVPVRFEVENHGCKKHERRVRAYAYGFVFLSDPSIRSCFIPSFLHSLCTVFVLAMQCKRVDMSAFQDPQRCTYEKQIKVKYIDPTWYCSRIMAKCHSYFSPSHRQKRKTSTRVCLKDSLPLSTTMHRTLMSQDYLHWGKAPTSENGPNFRHLLLENMRLMCEFRKMIVVIVVKSCAPMRWP